MVSFYQRKIYPTYLIISYAPSPPPKKNDLCQAVTQQMLCEGDKEKMTIQYGIFNMYIMHKSKDIKDQKSKKASLDAKVL